MIDRLTEDRLEYEREIERLRDKWGLLCAAYDLKVDSLGKEIERLRDDNLELMNRLRNYQNARADLTALALKLIEKNKLMREALEEILKHFMAFREIREIVKACLAKLEKLNEKGEG